MDTNRRSYRIPAELHDRIRALVERREAEAREQLPEVLRATVRVFETDVVVELLARGLELAEAEERERRAPPKRKR